MLVCITSYFNPAGYRSKLENFVRFSERIKHLCRLVVVEWHPAGKFALPQGEGVIQISSGDWMWQKEALLNVALAHLPDNCESVIWADNDVLFENENLVEDVENALEKFSVIQPWERVVRLPKGYYQFIGGAETHFSFGSQAAKYGPQRLLGDVGYAWAARRDVLKSGGFYAAAVADGGDRLMAHAFAGCPSKEFMEERLNCDQQRHFDEWRSRLPSNISVGYCPGNILHQYHGSLDRRLYTKRHEAFSTFAFNPYRDIRLTPQGVWEWATRKKRLHKFLKDYFVWRKEDE